MWASLIQTVALQVCLLLLKLQTRKTTVAEGGTREQWMASEQKTAADLFSGINYNTNNSEKNLLSGLNLSISILQVPTNPKLQFITIS